MKKLCFLFCLALFAVSGLRAQEIDCPEPDFIGETVFVNPDDGTPVKLEKQTVLLRSRVNATGIMFGIGKAKTKMIVEGPSAAVRLDGSKPIRLIVKAVDNDTDPMAIINIFRFEHSKKQRLAELSSVSSFGSVKSNKLDYVPFTGQKYGESSYLLTLDEREPGEYGITVRNPNNLDEKSVIVSTFAIE
ncbi:hypothetical protein [Rikenella microfusus]|uniref:hypothetical protein n=1 Tax=Rikenella microfusus TaxID=28139 RepID=UPI00248D8683|nr:hypothetical protein [Rikenella microfusus]